MVSARRLDRGDKAAFRAMNQLFAEVFEMPREYLGAPPDEGYVTDWLSQQQNIAVVAEEEGMIVGALAGYQLRKFEQARSEIFIYDLAVSSDHRRRGIASAMIEETRRIARECGAWTVFVQADVFDEDEPARQLYRKFAREEIKAHHFDIEP